MRSTDEYQIIGTSPPFREVAVIRDWDGELEVEMSYAFGNPDWFEYVGSLDINKERIHYFEVR